MEVALSGCRKFWRQTIWGRRAGPALTRHHFAASATGVPEFLQPMGSELLLHLSLVGET